MTDVKNARAPFREPRSEAVRAALESDSGREFTEVVIRSWRRQLLEAAAQQEGSDR